MLSDGRLAIEREPEHSFHVIVVDAFSDDSIPVHLLTREAFRVYFDHLRTGGLLAIHITNRYLDLYPVVDAAAQSLGKKLLLIHNVADPARQVYMADWVVVGDDSPAFRLGAATPPKIRLWTDEYSNLFRALR
jgi:spermidine synthase